MNATLVLEKVGWPLKAEKLFSVLLVAVALIFLQPLQVQEAIIVLGQGHFFACYYYQYKYHKIDRAYLIRYFAALILIFGTYILYPNLFILVAAASIYFVLHLAMDEHFLWKDPPALKRGLAFLPFFLIYSAMILDSVFVGYANLDFWLVKVQNLKVAVLGTWLTPYSLGASGVILLGYFIWLWRKNLRIEFHDLYFLLGAAVLAALFVTNHVPNLYYLMGAIILFHYFSWYIYYGFRWKDDAPKRNQYILDMLIINALVFGLYALYRYLPNHLMVQYIPREIYPFQSPARGNVLAYLFSPGYFYLWTLMHFVSTARLSDLNYLKTQAV